MSMCSWRFLQEAANVSDVAYSKYHSLFFIRLLNLCGFRSRSKWNFTQMAASCNEKKESETQNMREWTKRKCKLGQRSWFAPCYHRPFPFGLDWTKPNDAIMEDSIWKDCALCEDKWFAAAAKPDHMHSFDAWLELQCRLACIVRRVNGMTGSVLFIAFSQTVEADPTQPPRSIGHLKDHQHAVWSESIQSRLHRPLHFGIKLRLRIKERAERHAGMYSPHQRKNSC